MKSFPQRIFHRLFVRNFERLSFKASSAITSVSEYTRQQLLSVFGIDSVTIHNGICPSVTVHRPIPQSPYIEDGRTKILFLGKFGARKGSDILKRSMSKLGSNFQLICIGPVSDSLSSIPQNMQLIGRMSRSVALAHFPYCDIFLFPTRMEGFGLAVAEAMAFGKPAIVSKCSSMPELIEHERGGYLCSLDNPDSFVEAIKKLGASPELRKQMGEFNRKRVLERFTLDQMTDKYIALYESVLRKKRNG